ncbi:MAG TPA: hypothetical protein VGR81_12200 [Candidatus Acidoferrales bacterium]|nr:hypothetical protein [Candidatus Acidoferrales bacterium]
MVEHLAEPGVVDKRAIWIVHGMGQQVPFETLDSLTEGILSVTDAAENPANVKPPRVGTTKFTDTTDPTKIQVVQRVEVDLPRRLGTPTTRELHLYEAYWAPLTEGVPKLADVISFFFNGGLRGILNCRKPFRRAMFPDDTSPILDPDVKEGKCAQGFWNFKIPKRAAFEIVLTLLLLVALGAINAVILAASAAHLKFSFFGPWPISQYWNQVTAIATAVFALVFTFGAMLFLAEMSAVGKLPRVAKRIIWLFSWTGLIITSLSILTGAACMSLVTRSALIAKGLQGIHYRATQFVSTSAILAALFLCLFAMWRRAVSKSKGVAYREKGHPLPIFVAVSIVQLGLLILLGLLIFVKSHWYFDPSKLASCLQKVIDLIANPFWVWPVLLLVSKLVRDIMVEYPGDVAVYVTPNTLDRFDEVRKKIKQLALDTLAPLYSARAGNSQFPLYSKVGVVGHSLGSVIAYDTLNKLLTLDELIDNELDVAGRTRILATFGSPLDKTAFFFNIQGKDTFHIREQLAASVQPLIQDYARFRQFPWVNVYSPSDIICGELKFYDIINPGPYIPPGVDNVKDPDAVVPLIAHVEYWKNPTLWDRLFREITT